MGIDRGESARHSNDKDSQKILLEKFGITIEKLRFGPLLRIYPGRRLLDSDTLLNTMDSSTLQNPDRFHRTSYEYTGAVDVEEIVSYTSGLIDRGLNLSN
jgi:hypothetical protein